MPQRPLPTRWHSVSPRSPSRTCCVVVGVQVASQASHHDDETATTATASSGKAALGVNLLQAATLTSQAHFIAQSSYAAKLRGEWGAHPHNMCAVSLAAKRREPLGDQTTLHLTVHSTPLWLQARGWACRWPRRWRRRWAAG